MMTMFRNFTTYLLGSGENDGLNEETLNENPPIHTSSSSTMELSQLEQNENIEEDWIFIQHHEEEKQLTVLAQDFVMINDSGAISLIDDEPEENHENKENVHEMKDEYVKFIEWENRLIEHTSMSVYKSFDSFEFESVVLASPIVVQTIVEEENEVEVENTVVLSSLNSSSKQKRTKSQRNTTPRQQIVEQHFINNNNNNNNKMILYNNMNNHRNIGGGQLNSIQQRDQQFQCNSNRRNKYKNNKKLARVNNDRKCGCKKFV